MSAELKEALVGLLPRLRRFATALTGSSVDGDDLVQAVCERVLTRLLQLRSDERLDRWVYSIMRAMWIDELRARRVRRHEPIETANDVAVEDGVAVAEGRITFEAVRRGLMTLPEQQRTVLTLVCVDGLSYQETADILGIPIGTVMSRLARGRQDLHQKLHQRIGAGARKESDNIVSFEGKR